MTHSWHAGLFLLALVGCFEQNDALTPPLVENAELLQSEVFAIVIRDVAGPFNAEPQLSPVSAITAQDSLNWSVLRMLEDSLSPAEREADGDFRRRNADSGSVQVPLRLDIPYRWITTQEIRDAAENPYRSIRPLGDALTIGLSRVGFSRDYRKAFVYVGYACGALCGAGNFVLLERDATSVWHITRKNLVWVS